MRLKNIFFISSIVLGVSFSLVAFADHAWGSYHWGRTANPFTLKVGDNVSGAWDAFLGTTASDWSLSNVLNTVVSPGTTKPSVCKASNGRVEVCSSKYGFNGWLGIAQIWVSGSHITKGIVKVNDTYFNTPTYNTSAWRNLVMCQEVGHTLGLGHVDEDLNNSPLGTCMDYSADPTLNQHPNQHDFEMLETIYSHLDSVNTVSSQSTSEGNGKRRPENVGRDIDLEDPASWGRVVRNDARRKSSLHERDLGAGEKLFTFVIWVDGANTK